MKHAIWNKHGNGQCRSKTCKGLYSANKKELGCTFSHVASKWKFSLADSLILISCHPEQETNSYIA